jgi:hypothetical protein
MSCVKKRIFIHYNVSDNLLFKEIFSKIQLLPKLDIVLQFL